MSLLQIIYVSHPLGFDESNLNAILTNSRRNNLRDDVTGALICRGDTYLQLIEGPEAAIRGAYARIARDKRHANINFLFGEPVINRIFPEWAMRDDPARSWMWSHAEVAAGAITKSTRPELLAVFERLKAESHKTNLSAWPDPQDHALVANFDRPGPRALLRSSALRPKLPIIDECETQKQTLSSLPRSANLRRVEHGNITKQLKALHDFDYLLLTIKA